MSGPVAVGHVSRDKDPRVGTRLLRVESIRAGICEMSHVRPDTLRPFSKRLTKVAARRLLSGRFEFVCDAGQDGVTP